MGMLFSGTRRIVTKAIKDGTPLGVQAVEAYKESGGGKSLLSNANANRKTLNERGTDVVTNRHKTAGSILNEKIKTLRG